MRMMIAASRCKSSLFSGRAVCLVEVPVRLDRPAAPTVDGQQPDVIRVSDEASVGGASGGVKSRSQRLLGKVSVSCLSGGSGRARASQSAPQPGGWGRLERESHGISMLEQNAGYPTMAETNTHMHQVQWRGIECFQNRHGTARLTRKAGYDASATAPHSR